MNKQQITEKIETLKVEKNRLIESCGDTTINRREWLRAQIREIEVQINSLVTDRLNADDEESTDAHGNALCERCHSAHIFYADSERFCQSCLLAIEIEADAEPVNNGAASLKDFDDVAIAINPKFQDAKFEEIYARILVEHKFKSTIPASDFDRARIAAQHAIQRKGIENDTLQAKFDTVETLLHEANLELERVKAERDAACKAASNGLSAAYRAFREISNTSGDNRSIDDAKEAIEAIEAIEKTYSVMNALKAKEQSNG